MKSIFTTVNIIYAKNIFDFEKMSSRFVIYNDFKGVPVDGLGTSRAGRGLLAASLAPTRADNL